MTIKNYVFFQTLTISPEKRLFPLILHHHHATFEVATLLDFRTFIDVHMISQGHVGEATFPPWGRIGMQIEDLSLAQSFDASVILVFLSCLTSKDYSRFP